MKMRFSALLVLFLNIDHWRTVLVSCKIITAELCGSTSSILLDPTGESSSITILLNPKDNKKICKLNITAPSSHVVNLEWQEENRELLDNHLLGGYPCPLNVFLPENTGQAVWNGDPCTKDGLPEIDLLTPQLKLVWSPPGYSFQTRGRKLVITAVGQGKICTEEGQHTCMKIGWNPLLCVSEQLVCDGNPNCPKGSSKSDEDEITCKGHLVGQKSWEQLAEEVIGKLPSGMIDKKWVQKKKDHVLATEDMQMPRVHWKELNKLEVLSATTEAPTRHHHDSEDSVSAALAHYGPWGYLMLGMLICGTVLMFCGLWECCFRKPKPQMDMQSQQQPTTVLIINGGQEDMLNHQPPTYDELDQPPSYVTLFPNFKLEVDDVADELVGDNCDVSSSSDECGRLNEDAEVAGINNSDSVTGEETPTERRSPAALVTSV